MQAEAAPNSSADRYESLSQIEQILHAASTLDPLPQIVRYFDEYEEELRLVDPKAVTWAIGANGSTGYLRFDNLSPEVSSIVKCSAISQLHKNAITGRRRIQRLVAVPDMLEEVII